MAVGSLATPRTRRTQEERSADTRARLLDATIESLIEVGYASTTTTAVCERAGVSRGAQVHHFPRKQDLVVAAVAHLGAKNVAVLRGRAEALPPDANGDRLAAVVELVVETFGGPLFTAALELWIAARTDPELHRSLLPFERAAGRGLVALWREVAADAAHHEGFEAVLELTMHLARGMALQKILRSDDTARRRLLDLWREMARQALRATVAIAVAALVAFPSEGRAACDAGLALADTDPLHGAAAIDLCTPSDGTSEGLVSAAYGTADLSSALDQVSSGFLGVGLLDELGANVLPRRGERMLALSSGAARAPSDPSYAADLVKGYSSTPPPGFPADTPGCPGTTVINDSAALRVSLVAPFWAHSFGFDFKYYTNDYPEWACTAFNDQFVVLASPPPLGSIGGNLVFDSQSRPMTVNSPELLSVCAPTSGYPCASGTAELEGTGFEGEGATPWLRTQAPVQPGDALTLTFVVWDAGDGAIDTTVLLDHFRWSTASVDGTSTQVAPEPAWTIAAAWAALAFLGARRSTRPFHPHPQED